MNENNDDRRDIDGTGGTTGGHPSQTEGEDPSQSERHPDPQLDGQPSQAEGEDSAEAGETDG